MPDLKVLVVLRAKFRVHVAVMAAVCDTVWPHNRKMACKLKEPGLELGRLGLSHIH